MKKSHHILLCLLMLLVMAYEQVYCQTTLDKEGLTKEYVNRLPDLWIITLEGQSINDFNTNVNRSSIVNAIGPKGANIMPKDSVVILRAGIYKKTKQKGDFIDNYIHPIAGPISFFQILRSYDLLSNMENTPIMFSSMSRPLSLYSLKHSGFDFSPYRNIYHVLIRESDNVFNKEADMTKLRKLNFPMYDQIVEMIDSVESKNGELTSSGDGNFVDFSIQSKWYNDAKFHVFYSQYETYDSKSHSRYDPIDSLIKIINFQSGELSIMQLDNTSSPIWLDYVLVNGVKIASIRKLQPGQKLVLKDSRIIRHQSCKDSIEIKGYYIGCFYDHFLGHRFEIRDLSSTFYYDPSISKISLFLTKLKDHLIPILNILISIAALFTMVILITANKKRYVVRIVIRDKDYSLSRKAFKKMNVYEPYWLVQLVDDTILTYLDKGIRLLNVNEGNSIESSEKIFIITDSPIQILEGECKWYQGADLISRQDLYDDLSKINRLNLKKSIVYVFDGNAYRGTIRFMLDGRTFCIGEGRKPVIIKDSEPILCMNKKALAGFCTQYDHSDVPSHNNILINTLSYCEKQYLALNIYDMNMQNRPDTIYLRYVLVVEKNSDSNIIKELKKTAEWILRKEKQSIGSFAWQDKEYSDEIIERVVYNVVTPPLTCYLFLWSKKGVQLVYSPFQNDQQRKLFIDLPQEPFALSQFALFDRRLHRVVCTEEKYYDKAGTQTVMRLGEAGSNVVQEFLGERIDRKFTWGDIKNGLPHTCNMEVIKKITRI